MSHELRTPLNAIIGFAEVMQSGIFGALGSEKYAEYCRDIRASGQYLLTVINDILDMSRIEAGRFRLKKREVSVDAAIEKALRLVRERARTKKLQFTVELLPNATVPADERALQQILVNLLDNAVKFTPEGGRVGIRTRSAGDAINIYVEDAGIGIPKDALAKLGRPFEQVETEFSKSHKGSGLGLAIARSLSELHGGGLRIRSQPGLGTVVMVHLPKRPVSVLELGRDGALTTARFGRGLPSYLNCARRSCARALSSRRGVRAAPWRRAGRRRSRGASGLRAAPLRRRKGRRW